MSAQDRTDLEAGDSGSLAPGSGSRGVPPEIQDDGTWHRMHPLSPIARGWIAMVVVIGAWMNTVVNGLVGDFTGGDDGEADSSSDPPAFLEFFVNLPEWVFYGSMAAVGAIIAALGALYVWWFTRYQVTETHVRLRTGLVFRQERQTRLDRVQALDIHRPLVPRLLGLAELRFEVADAGETSVTLRYLKHDHARRLRKELLGAIGPGGKSVAKAAAGAGAPSSGPAGDPATGTAVQDNDDEELLLSLPLRRVILARLLTVSFIVLTVLAVAAVILSFVFPRVILPMLLGFIPTVLALGGTLLKALEISWGFKMFRTPEGLRLRYGLINKTSQTVPTGRIQALAVYRPLLWRKAGWSLVHVNVAGYGGETGSDSAGNRSVLLPVATDQDLNVLFRDGLRIPHSDDLTGLVLEGLMGEGDAGSRFTSSPERATWAAPIVRRRYGYAVTDRMLLARGGRAYRQCYVIPHNKLQSIGMVRGPVARRLDLADLVLHSIVGAVRPAIYRMDFEDAQAFVPQQLERGRSAPVVEALTESSSSSTGDQPPEDEELPALPWARQQAAGSPVGSGQPPRPAEAPHQPAPAYGAPGVPPGLRRP